MYFVRWYSHKILLYTVIIEITHFSKNNYQTTEMEQQILKVINHIKYVKKEWPYRVYKDSWKKSTTTFDETSVGEIICKMQQNAKIDGKFKIINPIYDDKKFAEDLLDIHPKICNDKSYIPEESVDTALTL